MRQDASIPMETQDRKAGRAIERFHFAFLEVAATQLQPATFALKGGGNLRLFLHSERRSRGLDFDFLGTSFATFGDRVQAILRSPTLATLLRSRQIDLVDLRRRKDSATVKRWKLSLVAPGMEPAPTKIEFSARGAEGVPVVERSDVDLARRLGARAVIVNHYPPVHAIEQKVSALSERSETQPRDVFDLDHLCRRYPEGFDAATLRPAVIREAMVRLRELTYAEYQRLVVDYLEESVEPVYRGQDAWEGVQREVASRLGRRLQDLEAGTP